MGTEERLSEGERGELFRLEATVAGGVKQFRAVGEALLEIQEKRLYRETHRTMELYMAQRWSISRRHGYRLMEAAVVTASLEKTLCPNWTQNLPILPKVPLPQNEGQARAIAQAPAEMQAPLWHQAVDAAGGQAPSAARVKELLEKCNRGAKQDVGGQAVREREAEVMEVGAELEERAAEGTTAWHVAKMVWHLKQAIRHGFKARSPVLEDVQQVRSLALTAHGMDEAKADEEVGE